jgi:hypothetical protein
MKDILTRINDIAPSLKHFINALVYPLQSLTNENEILFNQYRADQYRNGQKMVLQKAINDVMGYPANEVIIQTTQNFSEPVFFYEFIGEPEFPVFIWEEGELDTFYLYDVTEIGSEQGDFLVLVPAAHATPDEIRHITSLTQLYKLAGKTFAIVIV